MHHFSTGFLLQIVLLSFVRSETMIFIGAKNGSGLVYTLGKVQSVDESVWEVLANKPKDAEASDTNQKANITPKSDITSLAFKTVLFQFVGSAQPKKSASDWLEGTILSRNVTPEGNILLSMKVEGAISLTQANSGKIFRGFQNSFSNFLVLTLQRDEIYELAQLFQDTILPIIKMTTDSNASDTKLIMIELAGEKITTDFFMTVSYRYLEIKAERLRPNKVIYIKRGSRQESTLIIKNCYMKTLDKTMHFVGKIYFHQDRFAGIIWIQRIWNFQASEFVNATNNDLNLFEKIEQLSIAKRTSKNPTDANRQRMIRLIRKKRKKFA